MFDRELTDYRLRKSLRLFGHALVALVGVVGLSAGVAGKAHAANPVSALLKGVASSSIAVRASAEMDRATTGPAVARLSEEVLRRDGRQLTPFQRNLLEVNVLYASPQAQALLAALGRDRSLTPDQLRLLKKLVRELRRNPAVHTLEEEGRELKRHRAKLAAVLTARLRARTGPVARSIGGRATVLGVVSGSIGRAVGSRSSRSLALRIGRILATPGAVQYARSLPPLALASLATDPGAGVFPRGHRPAHRSPLLDSAATSCWASASLSGKSPEDGYARDFALSVAKKNATDSAVNHVRDKVVEASVPALVKLHFNKTAAVLALGYGAWHLIDTYAEITDLTDQVAALRDRLCPAGLKLEPAGAEIYPGSWIEYEAEALDRKGKPIGPISHFKLSIDDGQCVGHRCTSSAPGVHPVTATAGRAMAHATLTVLSGKPIVISPKQLPPGSLGVHYSQALQATGGVGPIVWSVENDLPPGLKLDPHTGVLSGAPADFGPWNFTVRASDNYADTETQAYMLAIGPPCIHGTPCAVAEDNGQVSVYWPSYVCCIYPDGPYEYLVADYVNGVWGGPVGSNFWEVVLSPGPSGPGGLWRETFDAATYGQVSGDTMYFVVAYNTSVPNPETNPTVLGTSNTVVVR